MCDFNIDASTNIFVLYCIYYNYYKTTLISKQVYIYPIPYL